MNISNEILGAQNGQVLQQITNQFGIDEGRARSAVGGLLPTLAEGMKPNVNSDGGLDALSSALSGGHHRQYLERPEMLAEEQSVIDGNGILGHLLGGKDASRNLAAQAASATGLDSGLLKQLLPLIASMAMGAISKRAGGAVQPGGQSSDLGGRDLLGGLSSFLDMDDDGSVADDLVDLARKFF